MSFSRTTARTGKLAGHTSSAAAGKKLAPPASGWSQKAAAGGSASTATPSAAASSLRGAVFDRLHERIGVEDDDLDAADESLEDSLDDSAWEQELHSRQAFLHGLIGSGKESQANAAAIEPVRPVPPAAQPRVDRELGGLDEDDDDVPAAQAAAAFLSPAASPSSKTVVVPSLFDLAVEQLGLQYHAICEQDIAAVLPPGTLTQAIIAVRKSGKLTDHHLPLLFRTLTKTATVSSSEWLASDCGMDELVEGKTEDDGTDKQPEQSPSPAASPSPPPAVASKPAAARSRPSPSASPPPGASAAPIRFAPLSTTPGISSQLGHSLNTATLARRNKAAKVQAQVEAGMMQPNARPKVDKVKAVVKTHNLSSSTLPPRTIIPKEFLLVSGVMLDLHAQFKISEHGWRLLTGFMELARKGEAEMQQEEDGAVLSHEERKQAETNFTAEQRQRLPSVGVSEEIRNLLRQVNGSSSLGASSASSSASSSSIPLPVVHLARRFGLWRPVNIIHLDVSFSGITSAGLALVAKECRNLVKVNICGCERLTNVGISDLVRHCKQIQILLMEVVPCLDDSALQDVVHGLQLLALDVGSCRKMTNVTWQLIGTHGKTLKRLSAAGCLQTTDFDVEDLSKCVSLVSLSLRACGKITDDSVTHLVTLSKRKKKARAGGLQRLDLGGCVRLSDGSINALCAAYSDSLTHLDLRGLTRLTGRCIDAIQAHCHKSGRGSQILREVTLAACTGITAERIDSLRASWPELRVLV